MSIDLMRIFSTDYAAVAALFDEAGTGVDGRLLKESQRRLIPSVGGFEIGGVTMDVPSELKHGREATRIVGSIGGFADDLRQLRQRHPDRRPLERHRHQLRAAQGPVRPDARLARPRSVDVSYDFSTHWDRAAEEIVVDNLMSERRQRRDHHHLGCSRQRQARSSSRSTARGDGGRQGAHRQGSSHLTSPMRACSKGDRDGRGAAEREPEQFRGALAGMAQGIVLLGLGATPDSIKVAGAMNRFISDRRRAVALGDRRSSRPAFRWPRSSRRAIQPRR